MLRAALHTRFGGLPPAFWKLWAGTLVNRLGTFLEPFLALYLTTARGLSIAQAGVVVALYGAGSVLSQPLGGWLADRLGRRATLAGSMGAAGGCLLALGAADALWLISLLAFLTGVAGDAYRPASQAAVADIVPVEERRRAGGLIFWAINLGFSFAAVAGGLLAGVGYGWLFVIDASTCLFFGALVWFTVPETRPDAAREHRGPGYLAVLRDRLMVAFSGLQLAGAVVVFQMFSVMPLAMRADGLSTATYGAIVALNGLLIVVLHPLVAPALLRRDPGLVIAAGCLIAGAGSLLGALADAPAGWIAVVAVLTLGEILNATVMMGVVAEIAPVALRGRYQGVMGTAFGLSFLIAPLAGTRLLGDDGRAAAPWIAGGVLGLVVACGYVALAPLLRRRRALALVSATPVET